MPVAEIRAAVTIASGERRAGRQRLPAGSDSTRNVSTYLPAESASYAIVNS
jgi:hypothetical protein